MAMANNAYDLSLFQARLAAAASNVEGRLSEVLARKAEASEPHRLNSAIRHGTLLGGKRFRAFLVQETAWLFGGNAGAACEISAALECVHAYSLIHDDLPAMDNDTLRRGHPTVWKAYNEWTAILAGDALLSLAFEIISDASALKSDQKVELVKALARASGRAGMVGGQVLDLEADKLGCPTDISIDHIRRLQSMKTGALIRFACESGAIIGGADSAGRQAVISYGNALGLAFQISDDLLDAEGEVEVVGKALRKDADQGKATSVSILGIPAARARLAEVVLAAIETLATFGSKADALRQAARFMHTRKH